MARLLPPICAVSLLLLAAALLASPALAQDAERTAVRDGVSAWTTTADGAPPAQTRMRRGKPPAIGRTDGKAGWGFSARTAALHQFDTDIDGGGLYSVDRLFTQANVSYAPRPGMPITVSFGYRFDGFDFDGRATGAFPGRPWTDVHGFSVAVPVFAPLGPKWFLLAVPVLRTTVEDGAAWDDGITGGGFIGAAYKVNDRLRIGPGLGVITQIEDDPSIFPVVIVDWAITPRMRLKTGTGLGATQGPGLFLEYEPSTCWRFSFGGRFDRLRFRLDDHGVAPGGVGEESAWALVVGARWQATRRWSFNAAIGASFLGELRLEDRDGNRLVTEDYDTAFFAGVGFDFRF